MATFSCSSLLSWTVFKCKNLNCSRIGLLSTTGNNRLPTLSLGIGKPSPMASVAAKSVCWTRTGCRMPPRKENTLQALSEHVRTMCARSLSTQCFQRTLGAAVQREPQQLDAELTHGHQPKGGTSDKGSGSAFWAYVLPQTENLSDSKRRYQRAEPG